MGRFVFKGNALLLCLHEYLTKVAKSHFQPVGVRDDRHNYYLTTKASANDWISIGKRLSEGVESSFTGFFRFTFGK